MLASQANFWGICGSMRREKRFLRRSAEVERFRTHLDQPLSLLVSGAPGIGKTSLVNLIARTLASHPAAI